jgi:hypothetical protein
MQMAGKPRPMSQIKQLLQLYKQGKGKKAIARSLNISKHTVRSYLNMFERATMDIDSLLALEDPVLEAVLRLSVYCSFRLMFLSIQRTSIKGVKTEMVLEAGSFYAVSGIYPQ